MRQILEVTAIARDVLRTLWETSGVSDEEKIARTRWVWMCLRFEQIEFLPINQPNSEGRAAVVSVTFAHIVDVPFFSQFGESPMSSQTGQAFINWFLGTALGHLTKANDAIMDRIAAILSNMLVSSIERPMNDVPEGDGKQLLRHLQHWCTKYLTLLPEVWRNRVLGKNGLAAKLGYVTAVNLSLGDGVDLPASALSAAIEKAGQSDQGSAELTTVDGRTVTLRLTGDQESTEATILIGE